MCIVCRIIRFILFINKMLSICFKQTYVLPLCRQTSSLLHICIWTNYLKFLNEYIFNCVFVCMCVRVCVCTFVYIIELNSRFALLFIFKMERNFCNSSQANCKWFSYKLDGTHFVWNCRKSFVALCSFS